LRRDEAPADPRRGWPRRHAPVGPGEAPLPQSGSDPADPRPVDRQVHGAPRVCPRGAQDATGGDRMTTITEVQTTQAYQVFIKAPPEQLGDAITTPEWTPRSFHGATITVTPEHYDSHGPDGEVYGDEDVFEFDPPRKLAHGWRSLYNPEMAQEEASRVTW